MSKPFEERVKEVADVIGHYNPANALDASLIALEALERETEEQDAYWEAAQDLLEQVTGKDVVNHPSHYAEGWSNGAEIIDITENLPGNRANVVKYVARAGRKNPATELEDLRKAQWYLNREIARITR